MTTRRDFVIGLGAAAVAGPAALAAAPKSIVLHGNWKLVSGVDFASAGIHPQVEKFFIRYATDDAGLVHQLKVEIANAKQTEHSDTSRARDGGDSGTSG